MIIPKSHAESPFELSEEEIAATFTLLKEAKIILDEKYGRRKPRFDPVFHYANLDRLIY